MGKNLLIFCFSVLLLSCSKHSLPPSDNQTMPTPQEGPNPQVTETPTPSPAPAASPTIVPGPNPSPTPSPTTTPVPVADRLEFNGASNASVNDCVPLAIVSKDALGAIPVAADLLITLHTNGYGSFYVDAFCNSATTSVTILNSQSSTQTYFRSNLGESLTLTATGGSLAAATHAIEIIGTALLNLQPTSFDYGSVKSGVSTTKTFVLSNSGTGIARQLQFSSLTAPFTISNSSCGSELRAQQNCIFDVLFSPVVTGSFSQNLSLSYVNQSNTLILSLSLSGNSLTPGVSDMSFASNGSLLFPYTVSNISTSDDILFAVKQDSSQKLITVGTTYNNSVSPGHNDMSIARINPDGTLDTTFNMTGKNKVDFGFTDGARAVAVQTDGKILMGGFAYVSSKFRFAIVRFLSNGTLDNTFGSSGKTTTPFSSGAQAMRMVLSQSGKAILAGNAFNSGKYTFALARYNTNGLLDNTFGNSGKAFATFSGSTFDTIQAILEDSSQNLITAGYASIGSLNKLALAKFTSTGTLDSSFGSGGTLLPTFPGSEALANALVTDSSNNIYITGKTTTGGIDNLLVMKFLSNGTIDNSFGTLGVVVLDLGSTQEQGTGITIDSVGRILISVKSTNAVLLRLLSNGQLDLNFGTNGRVDSLMGGTNSQANTLLIDTNGKLLIGGAASNGTNLDFAISRFLP